MKSSRSLDRQAMWSAALQQNRLPGFVTQRLNDARDGKTPWLSTMTAAELLIVRKYGIRPVAMVSATCALHYGYSWTRGHAEGWRTAIARLKQEAIAAGANAVVDVKFQASPLGVFKSIDYMLSGTAVQIAGLPASPDPIIATVPALEFVRLLEVGIVPVGIAIGAAYDWLKGYSSYAGYKDISYANYVIQLGMAVEGISFENKTGYLQNLRTQAGRIFRNQPLRELALFWEGIRHSAISELTSDALSQGNGVLAHTHFGELIKAEVHNDNQLRCYLARYIVLGTVVNTGDANGVTPAIRAVVDMRDKDSPFTGRTSAVPKETVIGEPPPASADYRLSSR